VSSAIGITWDSFSGSAGCQESSVEDEGECPLYVVVYVQSYGFVADVSGIGMLEFGPVLQHLVSTVSRESDPVQQCTDSSARLRRIRP